MAQKIWIDNGTNVDATWGRHIAYSFDNITWQTLNKEMLGVECKVLKANTASALVNTAPVYEIILRQASAPNVPAPLKFDLTLVQNQPGWTNNIAGLNQAIADITEWLGEADCCDTMVADIGDIKVSLSTELRTHNYVNTTTSGTIPAGTLRGSVLNHGSSAGVWNGVSLPRGVSIPWGDIFSRDTYDEIDYDATGTRFLIEYTT